MNALNLEMFIAARSDVESSQFHIMSGIQKIRKDFAQNKIYPPLTELIELYTTLKTITQRSSDIRQELPKRIKGIDLNDQRIIEEPLELSSDDLQAIEGMIQWALPHIQKAIEEG